MNRKKFYTLILAGSETSRLYKITIAKRHVHFFVASLLICFILLTAFVTDYLGMSIDERHLSQVQKENYKLKEKFLFVDNQLKDLEKQVYQLGDFSRKLQLITKSPDIINSQLGFGKIHSNSVIMALSASTPKKTSLDSVDHQTKQEIQAHLLAGSEQSPFVKTNAFFDNEELEIRIKDLNEKSELVKQNTWDLYTNLLEQQEILNNTPSILPTSGWVSSSFGYRNESMYTDHEPHFHRGVDIASRTGNPVVSTADGKVIYTGYDEFGYGNLVIIDNGYGLKTYYAHLAEIKTTINTNVKRGEVIASVGSTGKSTGPHLHYEVRIFGVPVNPDNYILDQNDFVFSGL